MGDFRLTDTTPMGHIYISEVAIAIAILRDMNAEHVQLLPFQHVAITLRKYLMAHMFCLLF
jgi:hypothetical protein